ncbi:helix-turn-helix domain-containing protein [Micromonospora sp. NPDC005220]|uniref:helix-turn-helix domain-containing protein n=1 Tax=Micromonospora sp. NPDC005220 TaxID=3155589 RepID=UPI0033B268B1
MIDKVPLADPEFKQIAPLLRLGKCGIAGPSKYRRLPVSTYLAAVRVAARRTRDQLAAKLGVSVQMVYDVEHGIIPDRSYLLRLARHFLTATVTIDDIIAVFPVLRPTAEDLKIQRVLEKIRLHPVADPRRLRLENELAHELAPLAKRIAASAAWRLNRPDCAEEVWGEGIVLAIRHQDPARGLFISYLKSRIAGLLIDLVRGNLVSGTETILHDYGPSVREAEESLSDQLGRLPTEREIARYLDIHCRLVSEVRRARLANSTVSVDHLDFFFQHAIDIDSSPESAGDSQYLRRLREMPDDWREIIYLHFHDKLSVSEICDLTKSSEASVIEIVDLALVMLRGGDSVKL